MIGGLGLLCAEDNQEAPPDAERAKRDEMKRRRLSQGLNAPRCRWRQCCCWVLLLLFAATAGAQAWLGLIRQDVAQTWFCGVVDQQSHVSELADLRQLKRQHTAEILRLRRVIEQGCQPNALSTGAVAVETAASTLHLLAPPPASVSAKPSVAPSSRPLSDDTHDTQHIRRSSNSHHTMVVVEADATIADHPPPPHMLTSAADLSTLSDGRQANLMVSSTHPPKPSAGPAQSLPIPAMPTPSPPTPTRSNLQPVTPLLSTPSPPSQLSTPPPPPRRRPLPSVLIDGLDAHTVEQLESARQRYLSNEDMECDKRGPAKRQWWKSLSMEGIQKLESLNPDSLSQAVRECLGLVEIRAQDTPAQLDVLRKWIQVEIKRALKFYHTSEYCCY
eukprot:COSAG01_NODE_4010_length_5437_cov_5.981828_2_plen_388_part_00